MPDQRNDEAGRSLAHQNVGPEPGSEKVPYAPPTLERLGSWKAVTLQQSIPIFP